MGLDDQPSPSEIARTLLRIEADFKTGMARIEELVKDHEARVRKVERWMYAVPPTLVLALAAIIERIASAK